MKNNKMRDKRSDMNYIKPNTDTYGIDFTYDDFNGMSCSILGNTGLRVSKIGLGTWKFGFPETGDGARVDEHTAFQIMDKAIEEGVTFWDTANRYNNASGNSERVIGKWLKANPEFRRHVILTTKLYGSTDGTTPNHSRLSRVNILESTYASLERLQTDHVELMLFHWFDDTTPIEESLMAIEDLISQDLIRYFGVSNYSVENLKSYSEYSEKFLRSRVQLVQNRYDILYKEWDDFPGVLDYCAEKNISFVPWGPLRQGLLTERYLDKSNVGQGDRLVDENILDKELTPQVLEKLQRLADIAHKYDMTLAIQTIAYMLTLPAMGPVIVSNSSVKQLKENALAGKITISAEQIAEIEKII